MYMLRNNWSQIWYVGNMVNIYIHHIYCSYTNIIHNIQYIYSYNIHIPTVDLCFSSGIEHATSEHNSFLDFFLGDSESDTTAASPGEDHGGTLCICRKSWHSDCVAQSYIYMI